jgi:hypothetical protein
MLSTDWAIWDQARHEASRRGRSLISQFPDTVSLDWCNGLVTDTPDQLAGTGSLTWTQPRPRSSALRMAGEVELPAEGEGEAP